MHKSFDKTGALSRVALKPQSNHQVLIIGGGIAGITAALDLADQGHLVHLVETNPSIGGRMAQLDKTFPTLDCSICILAPKMVEVSRHPNIDLLTYAEVEKVHPIDNGTSFRVNILQKPRYVKADKCTGCQVCVEKCPIKVYSEFDEKMGVRKAIYIPFPQAVPAVATIDQSQCLYFTKGICQVCKKLCPADAIDFDQKPEKLELEVASIIVATGFELLDPSTLPQYGYDKFKDVLTSLQFERLLCASGPTNGEVLRPSDKTKPKRIVFIQCVGSRNENVKPYCSQVCCMYATKEAITTKEHDPEIDIMVLYNDLKATGKNHEELIRRAEDEFKIKYIKGLPGEILYDSKGNKLTVRYADTSSGEVETTKADLVVLCPAIIPRKGSDKLAKILGIGLTQYGFFKSYDQIKSVQTCMPGIYLCGACQEPKDISTTVVQACGASALAASRTELVEAVKEEKEVIEREAWREPRIGVFVCRCGINIGSIVNVPNVVEYAKKLPQVVFAEERMFACSKDSQLRVKEAVKDHDLNRIVVAACTPRTHEPLFRKTCEEIGLNPYLFEMVNIREHDSWVHPNAPVAATEKAKELVRMGVARARLLNPLRKMEVDVTPAALVIGAGISGLTAAKTIADNDFKVQLVERREEVGGRLREDYKMPLEESESQDILAPLVEAVKNHDNIEVLASTEVSEISGSLGDYNVKVIGGGRERSFKVGTIVVATGSEELKPIGIYGYGDHPKVQTVSEFRRLLDDKKPQDEEDVAFILCAGAREETGRTYCSAVCCAEAIDCALTLRKKMPKTRVWILYRDIRMPFDTELYYKRAREQGITFLRYGPDDLPTIESRGKEGMHSITVYENVMRTKMRISVDRIVLATPRIPPKGNTAVSTILKIPLDSNGFFLEAHPKLRPVDFATDGIYLCGTAHSPMGVAERVTQGLAAASRALIGLMKGRVFVEPITADVDSILCIGCANCETVCNYGAVEIRDNVSQINPILCKGCGVCAVECPTHAITMRHFTDDQISVMIEEAMDEAFAMDDVKILAFFCNWCAYAGADTAGVSRFRYPPPVRIIRVMCSGRVEPLHILKAFLLGADGVLVGGCHINDCHYISGNLRAEKRVGVVRNQLMEIGMSPDRLRIEWFSAGEGKKVAEVLEAFTKKVRELGPSPIKVLKVKS